MLWVKSFHLIAVIAWFCGLLYLPRLFIYHIQWNNAVCDEHFKIMEKKLYYYITTPAAILAVLLGLWTMSYDFPGYLHAPWMHIKLTIVMLLILYHIYLGVEVRRFKLHCHTHSGLFYRVFNELTTVALVAIVILVIVKPFV